MPTLNATGIHVNSAGSSFTGVRSSGAAKTAALYNPGTHTATLELSLRNISGPSYFRSHVIIGFDTSGITELPSSATINLAIDSGTTATNVTAASHLFKLWQDDGTSGLSQNGFTAAGAAQNANGGYWNDFTGWHASNSWATAGVEFGSFSLQNAIDAAAAADNKLTITLTAAALQKMVDEDVFIVHFSEHNRLGLNSDPGSGSGVVAVVGLSAAVGSFTDDFTPFISYEEDPGAYPNAENESGALVGGDFTINTFSSAVRGAQFAQTGEQVPFSLGTPGARHLRGRLTAYSTEKGEKVSDKEGRGKKGKSKT